MRGQSNHSDYTSQRSHKNSELEFMARYTWPTLLALYEKLNLRRHIVFRNVNPDSYIELPTEASEPLKMLKILVDLFQIVKSILKRMQRTIIEDIRLTTGDIRGKILTNFMARYLPTAIPVKTISLSISTPANILLTSTILEIFYRLHEVRRVIQALNTSVIMKPLKDDILKKIDELISLCNNILDDPMLHPLIPHSRLIARDQKKLKDLEEKVRFEAKIRPKEYQAYTKLLEFREHLKENIKIVEGFKRSDELRKSLLLNIGEGKLYELFCFILFLETLFEILQTYEDLKIDIDEKGQVLMLTLPNCTIYIAYNAIPKGVNSKLWHARVYGLIENSLEVGKLRGLPDTIILIKRGEEEKKIVIDYKYTDNIGYIVQARFKALAYLYEFDADISIVIAKSPRDYEIDDEEVADTRDFYKTIKNYGGARIIIDHNVNGKILIIAYINPDENRMELNKAVMKSLIDQSMLSILKC